MTTKSSKPKTMKLSSEGAKLVDQKRQELGWSKSSKEWLSNASQILEPGWIEDCGWGEPIYPSGITRITLRRFQDREHRIRAEAFEAFCKAVGVDPSQVAEVDISTSRKVDGIPEAAPFYGRTEGLKKLEELVIKKELQLVAVYGRGGVGKTSLVREFIEKAEKHFSRIIWRSLESAPYLNDLLPEVTSFLSESDTGTSSIAELHKCLKQKRCLVIFDNWEVLLENGSSSRYRSGYEAYGDLLKQLAKLPHKSCLILMSRNKPKVWEAKDDCYYQLGTLSQKDVATYLQEEGFTFSETELLEFTHRCSNPWVLKQVIPQIKVVFGETLSDAVEGTSVLYSPEIEDFLYEQFQPLSKLEKDLLYWLAIRRNTATFQQLIQDIIPPISKSELLNALSLLIEGRSLVERIQENDQSVYAIADPVILKYLTNQLIAQNIEEIKLIIQSQRLQGLELILTHKLITETACDTELKSQQFRRIVVPIQQILINHLWSKESYNEQLLTVVSLLEDSLIKNHARDNITHLLNTNNLGV